MTEAQTLREKLEEERLEDTPWEALENHYDRGAVLLISEADLIDVAEAVATDDVSKIRTWMEQGAITRPTPEQADTWRSQAQSFLAIIVQPYVLIQEVA